MPASRGITVDASGVIWGASIGDRNVMKFVPPTPPPADACSTPPPLPTGEKPAQASFAAGAYPVALPAVSPTGVHNDLVNPYRDSVAWGQLPAGRVWGSTASVSIAPDGTIWAIDRCGIATVTGVSCDGPGKGVAPIFQFDPSGKLLKNIGADIFTGPHKMSVDAEGNLWVADNAGAQVFKLNQQGQVLLTLGKKNQKGTTDGLFDTPTDVAVAANGDVFVADGHDGGGSATGVARIVKLDKSGKFLRRGPQGHGSRRVRRRPCPYSTREGGYSWPIARTTASRFDAGGPSSLSGSIWSSERPIYQRRDDTLCVSDSNRAMRAPTRPQRSVSGDGLRLQPWRPARRARWQRTRRLREIVHSRPLPVSLRVPVDDGRRRDGGPRRQRLYRGTIRTASPEVRQEQTLTGHLHAGALRLACVTSASYAMPYSLFRT